MSDKIQADFEDFHRDNPEVYRLFDHFARRMLAAGFRHGSASLVAERIRWETAMRNPSEPVKMNNNYRACYARLWEANNPAHAGFFRKRERRSGTLNSIRIPENELV